MISSWLDRVDAERHEVKKWFNKLEFFSTNLKPRSALDPENLRQIDLLVESAFDCHLDKKDDDEKVCAMVCHSNEHEIFLIFRFFKNRHQPNRRSDHCACYVK